MHYCQLLRNAAELQRILQQSGNIEVKGFRMEFVAWCSKSSDSAHGQMQVRACYASEPAGASGVAIPHKPASIATPLKIPPLPPLLFGGVITLIIVAMTSVAASRGVWGKTPPQPYPTIWGRELRKTRPVRG